MHLIGTSSRPLRYKGFCFCACSSDLVISVSGRIHLSAVVHSVVHHVLMLVSSCFFLACVHDFLFTRYKLGGTGGGGTTDVAFVPP